MKFKVGDDIRIRKEINQYSLFEEKVIRIAKEGEIVKGPWADGDSSYKLRVDSYILKHKETQLLSRLPISMEDSYERANKDKEELLEELKEDVKKACACRKEELECLQEILKVLKILQGNVGQSY